LKITCAKAYKSLMTGLVPEIIRCSSLREEQQVMGKKLKELVEHLRPEDICLVARTSKLLRENYQPI
jgi:hypothetical protein